MNVPFAIAGVLALTGAAIHGIVGERIVVTKLHADILPSSRFGSPSFTKIMIRATWHITTIAFVVMGAAMMACAPGASSEACRGIGRVAALAYAGFVALTIGLVAPRFLATRGRRAPLRHPAPLLFALVAVLAWWGTNV
jgi:hypothetical protein